MEQMQMNMPDIYDAALYLRLSKDDMEEGGAKSESNSIANQRELLRSFVKSQPDIQIFDIYVDDGYSGGNFDRPEFKRMTTDIEAGKVNCVIVKDLSRFGREYIEAGRWIEKTYPALNVRFISVTDQFDSKTADFSEKSFVVPIKNFVNESYCRDISGKVRSHQKIKREKGEFIGAFAPYGYCKDPENKNCLVIDSYAADIVRKIFSWKIDGFSLGAIAEKLNVRHVQSPKEYKKANGENYNSGFHSSDTPKWSAVQIKRILTNEVYIGNMVQGKQERISYKVKQRLDKPESEWVKVENTHPAIIRQNDFDVVQKLLQYDGGFLVRNLESYSALAQMGLADKCVLDHSLYTWNDEAIRFWKDQGILRNTVPLELNEKELRHRENAGSEMIVYGRLPLMHSAQCVRKNTFGCNGQEERLVLKDRYDKEFPVVCYCRPWKMGNTKAAESCYNIIYNSLPYGLLKEADRVKELGVSSVRLAFTIESREETERIVEDFVAAYHGSQVSHEYEFTKGHFKRGAE